MVKAEPHWTSRWVFHLPGAITLTSHILCTKQLLLKRTGGTLGYGSRLRRAQPVVRLTLVPAMRMLSYVHAQNAGRHQGRAQQKTRMTTMMRRATPTCCRSPTKFHYSVRARVCQPQCSTAEPAALSHDLWHQPGCMLGGFRACLPSDLETLLDTP